MPRSQKNYLNFFQRCDDHDENVIDRIQHINSQSECQVSFLVNESICQKQYPSKAICQNIATCEFFTHATDVRRLAVFLPDFHISHWSGDSENHEQLEKTWSSADNDFKWIYVKYVYSAMICQESLLWANNDRQSEEVYDKIICRTMETSMWQVYDKMLCRIMVTMGNAGSTHSALS